MNILVINPPNKPFTNKSILAEPLDVLQIATIINKKHKVNVIDMDVNRMDNNINEYLKDKNIVIFVYDYQLPLHTSETINNMFEIIKNCNKETKFIIIGKTSSYYYEKFLNNGFDIVIKGIADNIINEVIDCIISNGDLYKIPNLAYKNHNKIILTSHEKTTSYFKDLDIPKRELLDISKYMDTRTMITSRGCIGKCTFCTTPVFFKNWQSKNYKQVVDEIEYLINNYNTKKIIFLDDNMTVDKKRMFDICNEIKSRNIKCLFGCLSSISCYDEKMFKEMYDIGFRWIHFGIESGSLKILNYMQKNMNIDNIKRIIKEVKAIGYRVRNSIILDYPNTTKEDLNLTRKLINEIEPHELRLHYLAYRVGTPIFEENKNIVNKSQYIHSNHPNNVNKELTEGINLLIEDLKQKGYSIIFDDIDWNKYNNLEKNTKIAAFIPIKYGMCWYE